MEDVGQFREWFAKALKKECKECHISDRTLTDILLHEASALYHKVLVKDKLDGKDG